MDANQSDERYQAKDVKATLLSLKGEMGKPILMRFRVQGALHTSPDDVSTPAGVFTDYIVPLNQTTDSATFTLDSVELALYDFEVNFGTVLETVPNTMTSDTGLATRDVAITLNLKKQSIATFDAFTKSRVGLKMPLELKLIDSSALYKGFRFYAPHYQQNKVPGLAAKGNFTQRQLGGKCIAETAGGEYLMEFGNV
ncbi:hypothetical protein HC761_00070 [bacterium]|nr:hypothetical protein [bacterium]